MAGAELHSLQVTEDGQREGGRAETARIRFESAAVEQQSHSRNVLRGDVGEAQGHLPVGMVSLSGLGDSWIWEGGRIHQCTSKIQRLERGIWSVSSTEL